MSNDKYLFWELCNNEAGCGKKVNLQYYADFLAHFITYLF